LEAGFHTEILMHNDVPELLIFECLDLLLERLQCSSLLVPLDKGFRRERSVRRATFDVGCQRDRPKIWGIMTIGIGPVGYVVGWGSADEMDAAFGWDRD
jgi:hypothetical protein